MFDAIFELNDLDMSLMQGASLKQEPAYALLSDHGLQFGEAAREQARLQPLKVNNKFISQLSLVETPELAPWARHHADIAYRYFAERNLAAGRPERLVFATPADYTADNMSVLLGIAQQSEFDAVGIVDQAIAAVSQVPVSGSGVFVDIQLHQTTVCAFHLDGEDIVRGESKSLDGLGMLQLQDYWVRQLSEACVQQCRYNPLHDASEEQAIWQNVSGWIEEQREQPDFVFSLFNKHRFSLPRSEVLQVIERLHAAILECTKVLVPDAEHLLFSSRVAELPGLANPDTRIQFLPPDAVNAGVAEHQTHICSNTDTLPFIARLPAKILHRDVKPSTEFVAQPAQAHTHTHTAATISHLLLDDTAHAFGEVLYLNAMGSAIKWSLTPETMATAVVRRQGEHCMLDFIEENRHWLNGQESTAGSIVLERGDALQFAAGGSVLRFIDVAS